MNRGFDFSFVTGDPDADQRAFQRALQTRMACAHRAPEPAVVASLFAEAWLSPAQVQQARTLAATLARAVRAQRTTASGIDALMAEFSLDSAEGVALMCLAEALLRIPDDATRDALIRDKLATGDWQSHIGASPSLFVNAAAWGMLATGKLMEWRSEHALGQTLLTLLRRGGEPLIRGAVDMAMRLLGRQFVMGRTIEEALANAAARQARGYTFSYDMLGEAAVTMADADRYYAAYEHAIHVIGARAGRLESIDAPGISIKLSALHPRYERAQRDRVVRELVPRAAALARVARGYGIGVNIDAEQADRLELSLTVLDALCADGTLAGWNGLGWVVQAYQKRARVVIDRLIALARRWHRTLPVRLVKGAYWDSEIKHAQMMGDTDYPVFTRKVHTDVSYLACARAMLTAADAIYPQFATHNAYTIGAIHACAGAARYEFQCLHGMGESVYDELLARVPGQRCRIYAPVGAHDTLLAYLVRRLLENGANSSFVKRIVDPDVSIDELLADPLAAAEQHHGAPHPRIARPSDLLPGRENSSGLDLNAEAQLQVLADELATDFADRLADGLADGPTGGRLSHTQQHRATPLLATAADFAARTAAAVRNPADHGDLVGSVIDATPADVAAAIDAATAAGQDWSNTSAESRAACLERAAALLAEGRTAFIALAVRESGKTLANAVAEVREAIDFLRYYAQQARTLTGTPRGPIVAISPWNFPLAIFVGQVAAALAAGNPVLAKPAEQTPLIAHAAVRLLHRAGVPMAALQLLPGAGATIGAALVSDKRIAGVLFTGSAAVAQQINRTLALRGDDPLLIAETGGQNAMIADSSALPEQVVVDALHSAFDSAGQRCSALRILCIQEDIAATVLPMLAGAMRELSVGDPRRLATDVGPVIDVDAQAMLHSHLDRMRTLSLTVIQGGLPATCAGGTFVAPALVDLGDIAGLRHLDGEVFGPVLHVLRWRADQLDALIAAINAPGYALTHGIATRINDRVTTILGRIQAGNVYVNRNIVGAVVGVQPFGGHGRSGTGPKAGGPLYLRRLMREVAPLPHVQEIALPGPTGETNTLQFLPRGVVACIADRAAALIEQGLAAAASGNTVVIERARLTPLIRTALAHAQVRAVDTIAPADVDAVLLDLAPAPAAAIRLRFAASDGAIVPVISGDAQGSYDWTRLIVERTVTVNTTAAGGDATLLSLNDDAPA